MAEMVRVNTRISKKLNDWLDSVTEETGISKSTQIMMALENYYRQQTAINNLDELKPYLEVIKSIQENKV